MVTPLNGSSSRSASIASGRSRNRRFNIVVMIFISIGLVFLGKAESFVVDRARTLLNQALTPVLEVVIEPFTAVSESLQRLGGAFNVFEENDRLKAENARLRRWEHVARQLELENGHLRASLNVVPESQQISITARVVGDFGGSFVRSILVNSGQEHGISVGNSVFVQGVLIGRIVEVGPKASRAILVTDLNSKIPVQTESGVRGILAGNNSELTDILHLPEDAIVKNGERVMTSGDGGVFPPGLSVGEVTDVQPKGDVKVIPLEGLSRLDFVQIVDFGLKSRLNLLPVPEKPVAEKSNTEETEKSKVDKQ